MIKHISRDIVACAIFYLHIFRFPEAVVCVEPSTVYFEKVSEELERIVKEVKESPVEEHEDLSPAALTEEQPSEGTVLTLEGA